MAKQQSCKNLVSAVEDSVVFCNVFEDVQRTIQAHRTF